MNQEEVQALFAKHNLPDVPKHQLETGTYDNMTIAQKFSTLEDLEKVLKQIPGGDPASRRSILSFYVDSMED